MTLFFLKHITIYNFIFRASYFANLIISKSKASVLGIFERKTRSFNDALTRLFHLKIINSSVSIKFKCLMHLINRLSIEI